MKIRGFVWKALLVIYDSAKLNLTSPRISNLWNSCKTCSSGWQVERSQPNYGLNAARIPTPQKLSYLEPFQHLTPRENIARVQNWASKCWVFGDHLKASIDCDAGDNQYHSHGHGHGHCLCQKWQSANCCQTQKWLKGDRSGELKKISWDKEIVEHSPITLLLLLLNMKTTTRKVFLWVLQYIWAGTWDKRSLETEKWWLSHSQNTRRLS